MAGEGGEGAGGDGCAWAQEYAAECGGGQVDGFLSACCGYFGADACVVLLDADQVEVEEGQGVGDAWEHREGGFGEFAAGVAGWPVGVGCGHWGCVLAGAMLRSPHP